MPIFRIPSSKQGVITPVLWCLRTIQLAKPRCPARVISSMFSLRYWGPGEERVGGETKWERDCYRNEY